MHTTNQILDAIANARGGATDYRLGKLLGTSSSAVGNWRAGRTALSLDYAHRAAALLEWDAAYVVACVEHERASKDARLEATDEIRATWEKIAQRFAPAAAVMLAAFLALTTPAPSEACASGFNARHDDDLYIMRSVLRRTLGALRRGLRAMCDAVRVEKLTHVVHG